MTHPTDPALQAIKEALDPRIPPRAPEGRPGRQAAVAVILAPLPAGRPAVLLIRRAEHENDPWSGHVSCPGGRWESGDRDLVDTARRECREEVGFAPERADLLSCLEPFRATARGRPLELMIQPAVFALEAIRETRPNEEVAEARWVSLSEVLSPENATVHCVPSGRHPAIRLGRWTLWGMTYMILDGILGGANAAWRLPRPLPGGEDENPSS